MHQLVLSVAEGVVGHHFVEKVKVLDEPEHEVAEACLGEGFKTTMMIAGKEEEFSEERFLTSTEMFRMELMV